MLCLLQEIYECSCDRTYGELAIPLLGLYVLPFLPLLLLFFPVFLQYLVANLYSTIWYFWDMFYII